MRKCSTLSVCESLVLFRWQIASRRAGKGEECPTYNAAFLKGNRNSNGSGKFQVQVRRDGAVAPRRKSVNERLVNGRTVIKVVSPGVRADSLTAAQRHDESHRIAAQQFESFNGSQRKKVFDFGEMPR
jgi:hypothetical protein